MDQLGVSSPSWQNLNVRLVHPKEEALNAHLATCLGLRLHNHPVYDNVRVKRFSVSIRTVLMTARVDIYLF